MTETKNSKKNTKEEKTVKEEKTASLELNNQEKPKISAWSVIKGFLSYYSKYMKVFVFDILCAIVVAAIDLAYPQFLRFCTNDFFTRPAEVILQSLVFIAIFLIVLYLIRSGAQYFMVRWGHFMGALMEADMRRDLFRQYQRLSFSFHDRNNSGELLSRLVTDLFDISELAHHGPENIIISTLKIVGSFVLLCFICPELTLILFVVTVIMVIWTFNVNYRVQVVFSENRERMADMNSQVQDSLGGIKTVKSFGNERAEMSKFDKINHYFVDTRKRSYKFMANMMSSNSIFVGLLYTVTIVGGGYFVATGRMNVAELAIFALYIGIYVAPIELMITFTETMQKGYAGFKRFLEVLALNPDVVEKPDSVELPQDYSTNIEYSHVDFSYSDDNKRSGEVLVDLNLDIKSGQKVALVGPSGQGKSTICSLLSRFYDVNAGSVKVGGYDVRDLTLDSLRSQIGVVPQDIYLFNCSIAKNIAYGVEDATLEDIKKAAKSACIHDFITSLEDGYDTNVGERGTRLSGGQKQRIAIARLFLHNPRIIVLDEATSALDNESESLVQDSLERLCKGRTTLIIAHRLSTIKYVDQIAVIDHGSVVEYGTHDELIDRDGIYAHCYRMQFKN